VRRQVSGALCGEQCQPWRRVPAGSRTSRRRVSGSSSNSSRVLTCSNLAPSTIAAHTAACPDCRWPMAIDLYRSGCIALGSLLSNQNVIRQFTAVTFSVKSGIVVRDKTHTSFKAVIFRKFQQIQCHLWRFSNIHDNFNAYFVVRCVMPDWLQCIATDSKLLNLCYSIALETVSDQSGKPSDHCETH